MLGQELCAASRIAEGGVLLVTILLSEIRDAQVAYALRDEMLALVKEANTRHLIIDVRKVAFVGSIGFLAFLSVRRQVSGEIILCGMTPPVREVFEISRLIPVGSEERPFAVEDTLEGAIARLV